MPEEQIQADLQALSPLSENGRTGTMTITFEGTLDGRSNDDVTAVTDLLDDAATENLRSPTAATRFQMPEIGATPS